MRKLIKCISFAKSAKHHCRKGEKRHFRAHYLFWLKMFWVLVLSFWGGLFVSCFLQYLVYSWFVLVLFASVGVFSGFCFVFSFVFRGYDFVLFFCVCWSVFGFICFVYLLCFCFCFLLFVLKTLFACNSSVSWFNVGSMFFFFHFCFWFSFLSLFCFYFKMFP